MKTFKLVGLEVEYEAASEKRLQEIELKDGLVLNREDGENSWLIEALISKDLHDFFEKLHQSQAQIRAFVTISKKTNTPAQIIAKVRTITPLEEHMSILLDGHLIASRPLHDPEVLLRTLMGKGLTGDSLIDAFTENVNIRKETTKL
ncbi:YwpF family protein [Metabacillus malikii]|uniref:YwpF-like protein n=1 Tax=Metabacillus malikii TaxID=1504265 RepID=A0ABT9ZLQ7_9BACI|nr:YwpF family protein [Metabacillus malikii]MDQ0232716.1 hypothetical protein [Metabacillus malikii]